MSMSEFIENNKTLVSVALLVITIVVTAGILTFGYEPDTSIPPQIAAGEESPERFIANATVEIDDPVKTEEAKALAANNVPAPFDINQTTSQTVLNDISLFFTHLADGAFDTTIVPATTTTQAPTSTVEGETTTTPPADTTTTVPETTTTTFPRYPEEEQVEVLLENYRFLTPETLTQFVALYNSDLDRVAAGEMSVFPEMQMTALGWATDELSAGIREGQDVSTVQNKYLNPDTRPPISIVGLPEDQVAPAHDSLASLVARSLAANEFIDNALWEQQKESAREAVPVQMTTFVFGDIIADPGDILTSVEVAAIQELDLYEPEFKVSP
jgi:membrane-associated HD superfamily phosphohydrolase